MDELIRRVDVARPLLEKYREAKRQAERALKLRNLGSCLAFRSDMETLSACIQIAVEAPAMGEDGREILLDALETLRRARPGGHDAGGDGGAVQSTAETAEGAEVP